MTKSTIVCVHAKYPFAGKMMTLYTKNEEYVDVLPWHVLGKEWLGTGLVIQEQVRVNWSPI